MQFFKILFSRPALLIYLNTFLFFVVIFTLNFFGVLDIKMFHNQKFFLPSLNSVSSDSFLLEKEKLKKQWQLVYAQKELLKTEQIKVEEDRKLLDSKLKEAEKQITEAKAFLKKQQEKSISKKEQNKNVIDLANKIANMPPQKGVKILEQVDTILAMNIIRQIDENAQQNGTQSISPYLMSLMKTEKAAEITEMISDYPKNE